MKRLLRIPESHGRGWPVLAFTCFLLTMAACSPEPEWVSPAGGGLISGDGGSYYYIGEGNPAIVIYHPGNLASTSSATSNDVDRSYEHGGALDMDDGTRTEFHYVSSATETLTLGGTDYDLKAGEVFVLNPDGTVEQLPFSGLGVGSREYLDRLKDYFDGRREVYHE